MLITINKDTDKETVIRSEDIKILQINGGRIQIHFSERWMISCEYDERLFAEIRFSMKHGGG